MYRWNPWRFQQKMACVNFIYSIKMFALIFVTSCTTKPVKWIYYFCLLKRVLFLSKLVLFLIFKYSICSVILIDNKPYFRHASHFKKGTIKCMISDLETIKVGKKPSCWVSRNLDLCPCLEVLLLWSTILSFLNRLHFSKEIWLDHYFEFSLKVKDSSRH